MRKHARQAPHPSPGMHGLRRPKTGRPKQITFWVTEEEKQRIEQAAAAAGVSMSRFVMERALKAAKKVLSQAQPQRPAKVNLAASNKPAKAVS